MYATCEHCRSCRSGAGREGSYLAANDGPNALGLVVDDTVDEGEIIGGNADRTNEQMLVTTTGLEEVHELVVNLAAGGILDLDTEREGQVVGERLSGQSALGRGESGARDEGGDRLAVQHLCSRVLGAGS